MERQLVKIGVFGKDKPGIVATVTQLVFTSGGNIEEISQNVAQGFFAMELTASWKQLDKKNLDKALEELGKEIGLEIRARVEGRGKPRIAVLAGSETHCLKALLEHTDSLGAEFVLVIGHDSKAKALAERHGIEYHDVEKLGVEERESRLEKLMAEKDVDFVVLANYLRLLSPAFTWRYHNRVINIHGSLLPAFRGPQPYRQAFLRGVRIAGATAHFVTAELDAGPIISQEAFTVEAGDSQEDVVEKGKEAEARAIVKAVKLLASRKVEVRGGVTRERA